MPEISLRAYTEYIQDRLAREAYSEVIAQCRHVLQAFPKYVEVYKLMARALMEQERYQDASDLFQRVLSADPSDFVAHVGMSDCYRESGALEQAIWHLERAFEQVPSNIEIQEAIKELYSESGKVPPRRVPLTSGALARLYLKGKLYRQAILELKKALSRDPERLDLQVLLAEALWQDHQVVEAGRVAAAVLKRLPNCISANRILAQLWLEAKQPQEARPFLERLKELDPYLAHEVEHHGQNAPADAFRLPMLDYTTVQHAADVGAADWVSQIGSIRKEEGVTGPLRGTRTGDITDIFREEAQPVGDLTEAPDWLKDVLGGDVVLPSETPPAGPAPAVDLDRLFGEAPEAPPAAPPSSPPDWLHEVLSKEGAEAAPTPPPSRPAEEETPDWLREVIGKPPGAEAAGDQTPDWLKEVLSETPAEAQVTPPSEEAERQPEWLREVLSETPPPSPQEQPPQAGVVSEDWLDRILAEGTPAVEVPTAPERIPEVGIAEEGEPQAALSEDWGDLQPWDEPTAQEEEQKGGEPEGAMPPAAGAEAKAAPPPLTLGEGEQVAPLTDEPEGSETPQDVPDWLAEGDLDSDEAIAWLEQIAAKYDPSFSGTQGETGKAAEEPSAAKKEEEELPAWLRTPEAASEAAPREEAKEEKEEELPEWLRAPVEMAAPPPPEEKEGREEELPEWLREPTSAALREEDLAWLDEQVTEHGVSPAEVISEALTPDRPPVPAPPVPAEAEAEPVSEEELPDWLKEAGAQEQIAKALEAPEAEAEAELEFGPAEVGVEEEELAWLEKALESEEVPEEGLEGVFEKAAAPAAPQPVAEAEEEEEEEALPDWLKGIGEAVEEKPPVPAAPLAEEKPAPVPALEAEEEELPAWLKAEVPEEEEKPLVAVPTAEEEAPAPALAGELEEELPDWLKGIGEPLEAAAEVEEVVEEKITPPVAEAAPPAAAAEAVPEVKAPEVEEVSAPPAAEVAPPPAEEKEAVPVAEVAPVEVAIPPEIAGDYHEQLRLAREKLHAHQIEAALPYYENLVRQGQMLSQTISDLTFALRSEQKLSPRVYRVLGDALRSEGRLQEALKAYRDALDQL